MVKHPKQSIHLKKTASQSIQKAIIKPFHIEICVNLPNLLANFFAQIRADFKNPIHSCDYLFKSEYTSS